MPTDHDPVALVALRDVPLSVDEVLDTVRHPTCGGIALFVGVVRDHDHGESVTALDYEAHPSAVDTMRRTCEDVLGALAGRAGRRGAPHRRAAGRRPRRRRRGGRAAPRPGVRRLPRPHRHPQGADTPIWKHQSLGDGSTEWVGLP